MKKTLRTLILVIAAVALLTGAAVVCEAQDLASVSDIRHWSSKEYTRVVIEFEGQPQYLVRRLQHPDRVFIDFYQSQIPAKLNSDRSIGDGYVKLVRTSQYDKSTVRVVLDLTNTYEYKVLYLENPTRVVLDVLKDSSLQKEAPVMMASVQKLQTPQSSVRPVASTSRKILEIKRLDPSEDVLPPDTVTSLPEEPAPRQTVPVPAKTAVTAVAAAAAPAPSKSDRVALLAEHARKQAEADDAARAERQARLVEEARIAVEARRAQDAAKAEQAKKDEEARAAELAAASAKKGDSAPRRELPTAVADQNHDRVDDLDVDEFEPVAEQVRVVKSLSDTAEGSSKPLALRRIVIDPGHGGKDPGALKNGLQEKDIVLDVAQRIKKELEARGGYEVILTRDNDTYIDLEERSVLANKKNADLFLSVHVNASENKKLIGIETYVLDHSSEEKALEVAARENMITVRRMQKKRDEVSALLASLNLQRKSELSRDLAQSVQDSMVESLRKQYDEIIDHRARGAMFYVLYGAEMPSALVEIGYLTNPAEAGRLKKWTYRQYVAKGIATGIENYFANSGPDQKIAMR